MIRESLLYPPSYSVVSSSARKSRFCGGEQTLAWRQFHRAAAEPSGCSSSYPATADQQLDLLGPEQVLERRLVGDHVEASPEGFELLLHALVQDVVGVLRHKLLWRRTTAASPWNLRTQPETPGSVVTYVKLEMELV